MMRLEQKSQENDITHSRNKAKLSNIKFVKTDVYMKI